MSKKRIIGTIFTICILIFISFYSAAAKKTINLKEEDRIEKDIKEDFTQKWYPGFMIVQFIKGGIAFILILMILFKLINQNESG